MTALDAATASGLSGGACMFYTPFSDRPLGSLDLLAFALRGQRPDLLTILCAGALAALLGLVAPVLTATVIDTAIPNADLGMLTQVGGLILVCALAAAAFELAKGIALLRLEGRVDARIQSAVTDRLLALPTAFFKRFSSGDLANRCLGINAIHAMVSGMTANAVLAATSPCSTGPAVCLTTGNWPCGQRLRAGQHGADWPDLRIRREQATRNTPPLAAASRAWSSNISPASPSCA